MKNKSLKSLIWSTFLFSTILCYSCQTENKVKSPLMGEASYCLKDHVVTEEAAAKQAEEIINLLDGSSLRSTKRSIASITPIGDKSFRSSQDQSSSTPMAYVVNFANDLGYAVLSADARLEPVWVISDKGNLDTKKPFDNPTSLMLMKQVELAYSQNLYNIIDIIIDELTPEEPINPEDITHVEYGPWTHAPGAKFEALIPVVWGQSDDPYNRYIPKNLSQHAGCVPAAVAQIMAFHSYPRSYNWKEMVKHHPLNDPLKRHSDAGDDIGRLYRDLGKSLRVQYSPKGSGAYSEDVPKTFQEFGYTNGGVLSDFSFEKVQDELIRANGKGYPIYISASDTIIIEHKHNWWRNWTETSYNGGHAFVIDGISKAQRVVRVVQTFTGKELHRHYETLDLLHANLGWDKDRYNGYYNKHVFNTQEGPFLKNTTSPIIEGEDRVYRYNFKIITGIRP